MASFCSDENGSWQWPAETAYTDRSRAVGSFLRRDLVVHEDESTPQAHVSRRRYAAHPARPPRRHGTRARVRERVVNRITRAEGLTPPCGHSAALHQPRTQSCVR